MIYLSKGQGKRLKRRFAKLYGRENADQLLDRFRMSLGRYGIGEPTAIEKSRWSEKETVLITYADSLQEAGIAPLATLKNFLCDHAKGAIETVHLLPFYPWSSDDGFSVIDFRKVSPENGSWSDVEKLGQEFDLMFDFVLNHCSRRSQWFRDFVLGVAPAKDYFVTADPDEDLSAAVRPRSSPLLSKTSTRQGDAWVWTTFSSDQVDLNWKNPDLLFEFLDILFLYLSKNAKILRLDAVAFLWKKIGTDCLHLPETHEVVKLFRDILDIVAPSTVLLTETNVPHEENISYFGKNDEAHMVYNFSLPPLVLYGLLKGDASLLTKWSKELPPLQAAQCFLNFTASHDGIGMRPLQGLVDDCEIEWLVAEIAQKDGQVSMRSLPDGSESPYELNISYLEALRIEGNEELGIRRFLASQALMLSMPGVPAVYIHSLLGTPNDLEGLEELGYNRAINRKKWDITELTEALETDQSRQQIVFNGYLRMLRIRRDQTAFHPNAEFKPLEMGNQCFGFSRTCRNSDLSIFCLFNFSDQTISVNTSEIIQDNELTDLISGKKMTLSANGTTELAPFQFGWFR